VRFDSPRDAMRSVRGLKSAKGRAAWRQLSVAMAGPSSGWAFVALVVDLRLSHHTLVQQFDGISLRSGIRYGEAAVWLFAAIYLLFRAMFSGFVRMRRAIPNRSAG
jgi:hypothetical protein